MSNSNSMTRGMFTNAPKETLYSLCKTVVNSFSKKCNISEEEILKTYKIRDLNNLSKDEMIDFIMNLNPRRGDNVSDEKLDKTKIKKELENKNKELENKDKELEELRKQLEELKNIKKL